MNRIEEKIVVLMTGAIKPNSFDTLAIKDADIRKAQYIEAINFYLTHTNYNIVFTENSGISLAMEFEDYNERIEFLTYTSLTNIPDMGKGAKELEIINYAMVHSKFIQESVAIVKITGRLKVLNIKKLYNRFIVFNQRYSRLLNCNIYKKTRMDSRCFFFTKDFWPYLKRNGKSISLKYSFEQALWDSGLEYIRDGGVYKRFKRPLSISGLSGGFGTSYDDGFLIRRIKCIRHYFRVPFCGLK